MEGLPVAPGEEIDHSVLPPIPLPKTLLLVNNFVVNTTRFLNRFSSECEVKLCDISQRITSTETTLSLLECKLRSIPGLEYDGAPPAPAAAATESNPAAEPAAVATATAPAPAAAAPAEGTPDAGVAEDAGAVATEAAAEAEEAAAKPDMADDPQYGRYVRMLKMHVPRMAVEMKMRAEGLDPDLIAGY